MTASSITPAYTLVSHALCPYVQRAAIALAEKGVAFERRYIDLADKPAWGRRLAARVVRKTQRDGCGLARL